MIVEKKRDASLPHRCHHGSATGACSHQVQFYDEQDYLHSVLSQYFAPFLADDDSQLGGVVLARAQTIEYLARCLLAKGYAEDGVSRTGQQAASRSDGGSTAALGTT